MRIMNISNSTQNKSNPAFKMTYTDNTIMKFIDEMANLSVEVHRETRQKLMDLQKDEFTRNLVIELQKTDEEFIINASSKLNKNAKFQTISRLLCKEDLPNQNNPFLAVVDYLSDKKRLLEDVKKIISEFK